MNLKNFDNGIIKPITKNRPSFPALDIYHAYKDVLLLCDEIRSLELQRPNHIIFDKRASDVDKHLALHQGNMISVLLKAAYMMADVFLCRFLGGLHERESMSMNNFITKGHTRFAELKQSDLLPAYCISIYRNKLVAHHDYKRIGGYGTSADGVCTLKPIPESFLVTDKDVEKLHLLRDKYQDKIISLRGLVNHFELISALFYCVPVGNVGCLNSDRTTINKIAEKGGCSSGCATEIVKSLDAICIGVNRCLNPESA